VNARSAALREELLALPLDERAEFAAELLASLDDEDTSDDPVEVDLAWRDELLRRSEQIATGTVATVGWDQVLERVADSRRTR
jgi:putative addiction module component (TIGR02574 family)